MRRYDTFTISPVLRDAVDARCEHVPVLSSVCEMHVVLRCSTCGATGAQRILPPPAGDFVWHDDVPFVTLYRVKVFPSVDRESPLDGVIGDSVGVFYLSSRYQDQKGGALRGMTYAKIEEVMGKQPDLRDLRKNLEAWLEVIETLDLAAGFDAALEALCAVPRWEELCYYKSEATSHRSAIDLSEVGYGMRDLAYYVAYLDSAEFQDAYGAVRHPALTWMDSVEDDSRTEPNWKTMPAPSRQVMELCLAATADCVRRTLRMGRQPEGYIEQVENEVADIVAVLREALQKGDDVAEMQDLLDGYHIEERSNQETAFYVVLKADEFLAQEVAADEYQAWDRGEVSDYRLETCRVYTPSEFEDIKEDARNGDWQPCEDAGELNGTWYGCRGLRRYVRPLAEEYAEKNGAHFIGFDVRD